jgi:uncharacterized membrane protein
MNAIIRFFASVFSVLAAVVVVVTGLILYSFGGIFLMIALITVCIIVLIITVAYVIYEAMTGDRPDI